MNVRNTLTILALALCLGTVYAVVAQRQQLVALRAQQSQEMAQPEKTAVVSQNDQPMPASSGDQSTGELLRLRSEVTRLTARKRELAGVNEEGERLRAQLSAAQTNGPAGSRLPPGYIRKSEAQMVGYSTPENTLQSLLWALQRHDAEAFLRAFAPSAAQGLSSRIQQSKESAEAFFKEADAMPGLAIQGRENLPDGSAELQVTFAPGMPPQKIRLQVVNGEWKLSERM